MTEEPKTYDPLRDNWNRLGSSTPEALAADSGAVPSPEPGVLRLKVIDQDCDVDLRGRGFRYASSDKGVPTLHLQFLILHYLAGARGVQIMDQLATLREFEGGALYYPVFKSRAIDVTIKAFSSAPDLLKGVGEALGAEPVKMGDVGFRVRFFPKLPIVVVLWLGDEEVSASANMLFDASAGKILATEDLSAAAEVLAQRLISLSGRR